MVPEFLQEQWEIELARTELLFLAEHGSGYPDVLNQPGMTPAARRVALRRLGFRVREEYMMPDDNWDYTVPWVRLTNGIGVCLQDGFVVRPSEGGDGHG